MTLSISRGFCVRKEDAISNARTLHQVQTLAAVAFVGDVDFDFVADGTLSEFKLFLRPLGIARILK